MGMLILMARVLLAPTVVSEMSLEMFSAPAWFASHHPDTQAAGAYVAQKELQQGIRRIMVYGVVFSQAPFREMERQGFEILFWGCLIGEKGYQFWAGYNKEMLAEAARIGAVDLPQLL